GGSGRLSMGGSITIVYAERIREELFRALQVSDKVVLEVMGDAVADVSFMQILCSAKKTALLEKKRFVVDWSAAPGVRQSIEHAGYKGDKQCLPHASDDRRSVCGEQNE
ncbi:MAG: STAS domain-containing protein, partial [Nitrospirota bacterium]|nr:STAS domain-containing protein [Nitrospirota bacterium]